MNRLSSIALLVISLTSCCVSEGSYVNDKLVRLEPLTNEHIQYLQALEINGTVDFWTETMAPNMPVDIHIQADQFDQFVSQFKQYSIPYKVLVDNLQKVIDQEQAEIAQDRLMRQMKSRLLGEPRANILGTYASYDDMLNYLNDQARANPSRVVVVDIGKTSQGRTIKGIELKYNPTATRNIWIDCGIHAREWITPATCIWIIDKLIEDYQNNDATVRDLLNYWNVYVVPSLNPDGYEFSRTPNNRLWRKSRNTNSGSTCIGVDLNRNYPWKWMNGGASNNPCADTYAGRTAGSEIETVGVVNFMQNKIGTWDMYMSFHSYGQWWFTPYGYTTNLTLNYNKQSALAQAGANAIKEVNKRSYLVGTVSRLLYIASGSTVDWAYDVLKCPYSYTIELPPTSSESATGFVLPLNLAPGVCNETYIGMKVFLDGVKKEVQSPSSG